MSADETTRRATAERLVYECRSSFELARQHTSTVERCYSIANLPVTFSIAGSTLTPLILPALSHLESGGDTGPSLKIRLWDDTAQSGKLPQLPWDGELMTRRGDIRGFGTPTIHATLHRAPEILSVADTARGVGYYFVRDVNPFPRYEVAAPLRSLFFWLLRPRGRFLVHAGAVGDANGAVLLAGKGGSGKSTTALACLDSDLVYLADDYCIFSNEPEPRVWSLYNTGKATPTTLNLYPFLRSLLTPNNPMAGDKTIFFLDRAAPAKLARTRPLKAIVLPRVTNANEPRLTPAPCDAATGALAISTMVQLPSAGSETLAAMTALTAQLPCYYLDLGSNVDTVPRVIQDLLGSL